MAPTGWPAIFQPGRRLGRRHPRQPPTRTSRRPRAGGASPGRASAGSCRHPNSRAPLHYLDGTFETGPGTFDPPPPPRPHKDYLQPVGPRTAPRPGRRPHGRCALVEDAQGPRRGRRLAPCGGPSPPRPGNGSPPGHGQIVRQIATRFLHARVPPPAPPVPVPRLPWRRAGTSGGGRSGRPRATGPSARPREPGPPARRPAPRPSAPCPPSYCPVAPCCSRNSNRAGP